MAAPTPTTRVTPVGLRLRDGFRTKFTFANDSDLSVWEISGKPPSYDGGDPIDLRTMWDTKYVPKWPRGLIEVGPATMKVAYDPAVLTQIVAIINTATTITVTYPDGSTEAYFGYLRSFERDELTDGEMPTATVTIEATMLDSSFAEQAPVLASVAGT